MNSLERPSVEHEKKHQKTTFHIIIQFFSPLYSWIPNDLTMVEWKKRTFRLWSIRGKIQMIIAPKSILMKIFSRCTVINIRYSMLGFIQFNPYSVRSIYALPVTHAMTEVSISIAFQLKMDLACVAPAAPFAIESVTIDWMEFAVSCDLIRCIVNSQLCQTILV